MNKLISRLLLLTLIVLLSGNVFAWVIEGNCVVEDNPKFRLEVCPYTSSSPVGANEQTFTLTNKTGFDLEDNVYVVYKFGEPLESGSVARWIPASYGWDSYTDYCLLQADYFFELNVFPEDRNPHWGECWETIDVNEYYDYNSYYFQRQFRDYSGPEREVYYDVNTLLSGNRWMDSSHIVSHQVDGGEHYYFTTTPTTLLSGKSKTWKISYTPSAFDTSKKWELGIYSDDSPYCIFDDTCNHIAWLDPWWNNDFQFRNQITVVAGTEINNTMTLDLNGLDTTDSARYENDCNDLRIVYQDAVDLNRIVIDCRSTNTKVFWKAQATIASGATSTDYEIYHGNLSATAPSVDMNNVGLWGDRFEGGAVDGSWTKSGSDQHFDINGEQAIEAETSLTMRTTGNSVLKYNYGAIHAGTNIDILLWLLDDATDTVGIAFFPQILNPTGLSDLRIAIQTDINTEGYSIYDGTWQQIATPRTTAWHEIRIEYFDTNSNSSIFIDDANVFGGGGFKIETALQLETIKTGTSDLNVFFDSFLIRTHVDNKPAVTFAADETISSVIADFNTSPASPYILDSDSGITSITLDFNDTSTFRFGDSYASTVWDENGVQFSTDQNTSRTYSAVADFNITQIVTSTDGNVSQHEEIISITTNPQDLDINIVAFNATAATVDVNYGVTSVGTINYAVWGFPNDQNQAGLIAEKTYREGDVREVCVVVNGAGDVNKLRCENFFTTHVIAKVPKNITNLGLITPFDVSVDSVPAQAFSGVSVDQNFWFFYQNLDSNTHNLIVDANVEFFLSTYFIGLNGVDLNQTIQPYVVPVTDGINVIFTAKDSLTNDTVQGVVIDFSRNVSTDGIVLVESGVTDDLGRISLPFIAGIDHNFTLQFPFGTILKTGTYIPQSIDATNGIGISVPSVSLFDVNAVGVTDVNFLQSQVDPASPVDLNVIVTSVREIASATATVDWNGVQQATDSNSDCATGCSFGFSIDVAGFDERIPLIVTIDLNYVDGGTFQLTKAVTISRTRFDLFESFTTAKTNDLGGVGGTMVLAALIISLILGIIHFSFPVVDNSHSFVIAATILLFLSFVGWIDGVTWILATIAGGAIYFSRRVDK